MALTQISTDGIKNGTITGGDLATNVDLVDNQKIRFGNGNDLQIYHDGNQSVIKDNGTGQLLISGENTIAFTNAAATENYVRMIKNGTVELYYDNSKKFETTANGADFTVASNGQVNIFGSGGTNGLRISGPQSASSACLFFNTNHVNVSGGTDQYTIQCGGANHKLLFKHGDTTGNVVFELDDTEHVRIPQDNKALKIGAGQDLQIYHDGSDSFLINTTGTLMHKANVHHFRSQTDENMAKFAQNGAVELYYDNTKRFETISSGAKLIGDASIGSICEGDFRFKEAGSGTTRVHWRSDEGDLKFNDDYKATFGSSNDLQIYHDGTNNVFNHVAGSSTRFMHGNEKMLVMTPDSHVELYYDNSLKFQTHSAGVLVSGNVYLNDNNKFIAGTSNDLQIYHDGSHSYIQNSTGSLQVLDGSTEKFRVSGTGTFFKDDIHLSDSDKINLGASNDLQIYHDGSDSFIKDTGTGGIRIDSNQTIIRSESGDSRLEVSSNGQINHRYTTSANPKQIYHWSNNRTGMSFRSANTERGNIFFFDSGVQFNTSSDYRLKENVTSISDGITRIKQLIPRKFNWIIDESNTPVDGFLAHEVSSIVPEAVNGTKDAVATEEDVNSGRSQKVGDPIHQMIDHSKLVPLLAAGLKEAISKIEILETEVAVLKAS